jgi:hypothetical protein
MHVRIPAPRAGLALGASLIVLAACQPQSPAPASEPAAPVAEVAEADPPAVKLPMLQCGPDAFIGPADTRESIAARHGAENLREETVRVADSEDTALVLFPDNPATRTEILWLGATAGGPRHVRVSGADSQFLGPAGLFIGATLADVEAANGGPFELMGFGNHNAGEITDWLGGKLATPQGSGCDHDMEFDIASDLPEAVAAAVSTGEERRFRSDSAEMRAANPTVGSFMLNYR